MTRTRIKSIKIFELGVQKHDKIWDPALGGKGGFVTAGETVLEQGGVGSIIEVQNIIYEYNVFTKGYSSVEFITTTVPATDPNDNTKEVNPEPIDTKCEDAPVIGTINAKEIEKITKTPIKINPPVIKKSPSIIPGTVLRKNIQGLYMPYVQNTGIEFISPTNKEFPARKLLKKIINDVNNSPSIKTILISGTMFSGSSETAERVRASFYSGLLKLNKIMHELGLDKKVNVMVDYENTKSKITNSSDSDPNCEIIQFKFK